MATSTVPVGGVPTMQTIAGTPVAPSLVLHEVDEYDARLEANPEHQDAELAMSELERAAGVESLDALLFLKRKINREFAPLEALFGGGLNALADARRKQHRQMIMSTILVELRQAATDAGGTAKDPSESALERMANGDARHIAWCDNLEQQRARWQRLKDLLTEVDERIRSRTVSLTAHYRLQPAMTGADRWGGPE